MNDWRKVRLGDICKYSDERIGIDKINLHNYISTENMLPEKGGITISSGLPKMNMLSAYMPNDTLISNIRPYFKKIWLADKIGGCSNDVLVMKASNDYDDKFLYYILSDDRFFEHSTLTAKGTKMPRGDKSAIMNYIVPLPPLAEQRGIAGVLSSLDDKIEVNNRLNKKLEEMAQAIFKAWFVDGVGDDWEEGCLNDILSVKGGGTPSTKKESYWDGNFPWVTPKDLSINPDLFLSNTSRKITKEGLSQISSGLLPAGTILLSSRAPIGYLSIADIEVAINQGFIAIFDDKGYSKYFIYFWIRNNIDYIISNANGSTFLEINKAVFRKLKITKPPIALIAKFDILIEPIFEKIKNNSKEIRVLEKMRDALLPKLMSGEVRVKEEKKE